MSLDRVKAYLSQFGFSERVLEFAESSATVELAAAAVGCEPAHIAKSLTFLVDGHCVMIVAAGDAKVDNQKYKAQFGTKAKMLSPAEAEEHIGLLVGGICPFAIKEGVEVYLDVSLRRFETVYPAAGSGNSAVGLTCEELERCAQGVQGWADLCKGWQAE